MTSVSNKRESLRQNVHITMKQFNIQVEDRDKIIKILSNMIQYGDFIRSPNIRDPIDDNADDYI